MARPRSFPIEQHRIAVGKEAVAIFYGIRVSLPDIADPRESGDQHEERGFRQMEVGDEAIDNLEPEPRGNEKIGFRRARHRRAETGSRSLEPPHRSRSDCAD